MENKMKMRLVSFVVVAAVGLSSAAPANQVTLVNHSDYPIPLKYRINYHDGGKAVKVVAESQAVVQAKSQLNVQFSPEGHQHSGVSVIAVKEAPQSVEWHYLPEYYTQFDGRPGCWSKTDSVHPAGKIDLTYRKGPPGKSQIGCRFNE